MGGWHWEACTVCVRMLLCPRSSNPLKGGAEAPWFLILTQPLGKNSRQGRPMVGHELNPPEHQWFESRWQQLNMPITIGSGRRRRLANIISEVYFA